MNHPQTMVSRAVLLLHLLGVTAGASSNGHHFEEDFLQTFFAKPDRLKVSKRLKMAGRDWVKDTQYETAVGITVENWLNQRLEFPELNIAEGAVDRWLQPVSVERHTRDIALLAHGTRGGGSKGSVSFLIEDSWPRTWVSLGWNTDRSGLRVLLAVSRTHLAYEELEANQAAGLLIEDRARLYRATDKYVVSAACIREGQSQHLTLSVVPQNMDIWAWEKYYKAAKAETLQHQVEPQQKEEKNVAMPTSSADSAGPQYAAMEDEPGIFERKDLLLPGVSARVLGNRTEMELLARSPGSVGLAIRLENWSRYRLHSPHLQLEYGRVSEELPLTSVEPGHVESFLFQQSGGLTGVAGAFHWQVGDTGTVLNLMISVPYNPHLWSTWAAMGLTKMAAVPDFAALYSGTPDSTWFIREKTGRRMEFTDGELILVMDSDSGTSKPVIRLALVPLDPKLGAESIRARLEGRAVVSPEIGGGGLEGPQSVVSALSSAGTSASQCYCPCMNGSRAGHCRSQLLLIALFLHLQLLFAIS